MKESQLASLKRVLEDHFNIEVVLLDNNELICHFNDLVLTATVLTPALPTQSELRVFLNFKNQTKVLEVIPSIEHLRPIDRDDLLKYFITDLIRGVTCAFYTLKREKVS